MLYRASLPLMLALAACGGGSGPASIDAASQSDAGPPSVRAVSCPPGVVPTVTTVNTADLYSPPSTTISTGGIVKFALSTSHDVSPDPSRNTDAGLRAGFGATVCLEFDKAGSFGFQCSSHGFTGTIVVR